MAKPDFRDESDPQRRHRIGSRRLTEEQQAVIIGACMSSQWKVLSPDGVIHDVSRLPGPSQVYNLLRELYPETTVSKATVARFLRAYRRDHPELTVLARGARERYRLIELPRVSLQRKQPQVDAVGVSVVEHRRARLEWIEGLRRELDDLHRSFTRIVIDRAGGLPVIDAVTGKLVWPKTEEAASGETSNSALYS
jgi:hypothetical protein